ncbi:hypothetical protein KUM_1231 [Taylorella asinigenitalis 14/45]|uniref:Uncharacterized protein n=1 Tax=Taylorella asinigenitalis 14/45 TaxID=1091495 RepID=I7JS31_9BURK|nr:DUF3540 domain-containing protein [Taylorella asinigenitalis]CCG20012.1 hypothetical protein KUM_1231 [Taylorella asinigenitalis 14/45]
MDTKLKQSSLNNAKEPTEINKLDNSLFNLLNKQTKKVVGLEIIGLLLKAKVIEKIENSKNYKVENLGSGELLIARLSHSCIFEPNLGDVVQYTHFSDDTSYILNILESSDHEEDTTKIKITGNLEILCKSISLTSDVLSFKSKQINIDSFMYKNASHIYEVETSLFKSSSQSFSLITENYSTKTINSNRLITGTDKVRALNINYSAASIAKVSGNITMVNGRELFISDGETYVSWINFH